MRRSTIRIVALMALCLGAPLGSANLPGGTASARIQATPIAAAEALDLAAMLLVPSDLDEPGYGHLRSHLQIAGEPDAGDFRNLASFTGHSPAEISQTFTESGWQRSHASIVARPATTNPDDVGRYVLSYVAQFGDQAGAARAYSALEAEQPSVLATDLPLTEIVGDQSELTVYRDDRGSPQPFLVYSFLTGNLIAIVEIVDQEDDIPDADQIIRLADTFAGRIARVVAGAAPGLSTRVLRLTNGTLVNEEDFYELLAGDLVVDFGDEEWQITGTRDYLADAVDVYRVYQSFTGAEPDLYGPPYYSSQIFRFSDAASASAWLADERRDLGNFLAPATEVRQFGDESLTETHLNGPHRYVTQIEARLGAIVIQVALIGPGRHPLAAIEALAAAQLACLERPACAPVPVPQSFLDAFAAPIGQPSPTATVSDQSAGLTVDLVNVAFEPRDLTIPANTDVWITLVNKGVAIPHTFNVDALDVHSGELQPGATTTVLINAAPGDYEFYCAIPGHKEAGMVGTLHVVA